MNTIKGGPTRLASGAWGVKIETAPGRPRAMAGDAVRVRTRAGKQWDAVITRIIEEHDGIQIASTASSPRREPQTGCVACRRTATRHAQIWDECEHCGTEPIYV